MLEFVLANIAMVSAGVVLYLVACSLPRMEGTGAESKGMLERWVSSELPERLDETFNSFVGKFLRRLRVIILKIDNAVSESLKRVKSKDASKSLDFKEMIGDKEEALSDNENKNENEDRKKK